jgi:hypothetical protein
MARPSHALLYDHPNNTRSIVRVMKLLIKRSPPVSCHFLHLRSKYFPQCPVLKHPPLRPSLSVRGEISHPYLT